ncbi:hypothetical protein V6N11_039627 [Hibiscus sabdariffa]|uniref:Uncharacterized protein n=1 Tax=Hibiscus sabdariffa TaxID=183260 RepID=A0ABR2SNB5_9ROSI
MYDPSGEAWETTRMRLLSHVWYKVGNDPLDLIEDVLRVNLKDASVTDDILDATSWSPLPPDPCVFYECGCCGRFRERNSHETVSCYVIRGAPDFFLASMTSTGAFLSFYYWDVSLLPNDVSLLA